MMRVFELSRFPFGRGGWQSTLFGAVITLLLASSSQAAQIGVQYQEGVVRAFPVLRSINGERLAQGDYVQIARGDLVTTRLVFRFADGSIHDETVVFSQGGLLRLLSYRIVQRGPSFPETIEGSLDRETSHYEIRHRLDADSPEEFLSGTFEVPDDAYNGMLSLVVKNLAHGASATVSIVAFTPKPRSVKLQLRPVAEEPVHVGEATLVATRYHVRPELGLFASLLVIDIPDTRIWILSGAAPAFLRAEGPLYFMGPIWRIEP
jgi:hypothetical protein